MLCRSHTSLLTVACAPCSEVRVAGKDLLPFRQSIEHLACRRRRAGRAAKNHVFVVVSVSIRTAAAYGRPAVVVAEVGTTKQRMAVKPALRLTVPAPSCRAAVWEPATLVGGAGERNFAGLPPQIVM